MPTMSGGGMPWFMSKRSKSNLIIFVFAMIFSVNLVCGASLRNRRASNLRSSTSVKLNGRIKEHHAEPETCPLLSYCICKSLQGGLDITCERVNSYKLKSDCETLKKKERFVKYFKIRLSDIPKLDDHIFMGIKIQHLYIHDSNLKALGPNSLSSQGNTLSHLVLSKNSLASVPTEAIRQLRNLDHLNLNENNITVLKQGAFIGLGKMTRLAVYNNQIHKVHSNAFDGLTRDLIRLNLGKNHLESIPHEALIPLKYLRSIDFTYNRISYINAGDFTGMDNLDQLILNHNKIPNLGAGFFRGLDALTTLYIDHNEIRTVHKDAFEGLDAKLSSLTLTGNKIESFPSEALRRIHQLETLHMDDNKISRLDEDAFQGFGEHVKFLWLQNNLIRDVPAPAFQDLHSLEWIKLYNNELRTLHYELMEPVLDTLIHIDIHSNPLVCDCDLRWYRQWIDEEWNEIEEDWLQDTLCEDPADKQQHNIAQVPLKDMLCNEEVSDKPASIKDDGGGAISFKLDFSIIYFSVIFTLSTTLLCSS
ncbi:hypothetical protein TCAL_10473 [Tigriopus californicus]|uniref:LRRCT domain-containing protein n=1 Tax=Tigriopus californicus TaxID=6832 RepID=A0A553NQ17_TIGCA|nr:chondroadherin-like isoform X2 [Tigriopus californicus]TRY67538.1 hypothetical protein TCAL_10473 [Tigriopus californicus]|eukprot:TCALIF_10473-PA protein Name:"Similar to CHAD Chondroadherin (Homo sapiens)" AED:0.00 eAED:0.00 QI:78/0.9/0.81/1/0.5/0.72/11/986/532